MNSSLLRTLASTLLLAVASATSFGQQYGGALEPLWPVIGGQAGMENGSTVIEIPDVDGDGIPEVVTSAPYFDTAVFVDCGSVVAHSGATGAFLWAHDGLSNGEARGFSVAPAGDWNADGVGDVIVGIPFYDLGPGGPVDAGIVKILNGITGVQVWTFSGINAYDFFGACVAGGFDYDGDGAGDVMVAAPGYDGGGLEDGRVYLFANMSAAAAWTFDGPAVDGFAGFSLAHIGDIDGDSFVDFVVGAPNADPGGVVDAGEAYVVSGVAGALYAAYPGPSAGAHFGHSVAGGRDVSGDLIPDFVITAPAASPGGRASAGVAQVRDGSTGSVLYRVAGAAPGDRLGLRAALAEDLNADAPAEVMVAGMGAALAGFVQIFDGPTGTRLHVLRGAFPGDQFGFAMASVGDQNGSGYPEIAIGAPGATTLAGPGAGVLQIYSFSPVLTASSGTIKSSTGGSVDFGFDFPVTEAGRAYVLLASASGTGPFVYQRVAIPLTNDSLFLSFATGSPPSGFSGVTGTLDAAGDGLANFTALPGALASYVGKTVWLSVVAQSAPMVPSIASVAVTVTIVP